MRERAPLGALCLRRAERVVDDPPRDVVVVLAQQAVTDGAVDPGESHRASSADDTTALCSSTRAR